MYVLELFYGCVEPFLFLVSVEGKSPCGQVDLLLRVRLLTLKTKDA
jgi:hypothetical protein